MNFYQMWQLLDEALLYHPTSNPNGLKYLPTTKANYQAHLGSMHDELYGNQDKVGRFDLVQYFNRVARMVTQYNKKLYKLYQNITTATYPQFGQDDEDAQPPEQNRQQMRRQAAHSVYEDMGILVQEIMQGLQSVSYSLGGRWLTKDKMAAAERDLEQTLWKMKEFKQHTEKEWNKVRTFRSAFNALKATSQFFDFIYPMLQNVEGVMRQNITAREPDFSPPGPGGVDHPEPTLAPPTDLPAPPADQRPGIV